MNILKYTFELKLPFWKYKNELFSLLIWFSSIFSTNNSEMWEIHSFSTIKPAVPEYWHINLLTETIKFNSDCF